MSGPHETHVTRISVDASTYDEICIYCGATDRVPGGWGDLAFECEARDPALRTRIDTKIAEAARTHAEWSARFDKAFCDGARLCAHGIPANHCAECQPDYGAIPEGA